MTFEKALTAKLEFSGVSGSIAGETGANAANGLGVAGGTRWRPIETAPRDGTPVLTYLPPLPHQTVGWINIQKWKGDKAGWISVGKPKRRTNFQPTHWQPLPTPPEAS